MWISCAKGLRIAADYSFKTCPKLDFLLVPGGQGTRKEVHNKILIEFIKDQARHCEAILSVCTGAFLLQQAGLLDGIKATTHWASLDRLKAFQKTQTIEKRFVRDQHIWTSAGISAGIDMALAFIAETASPVVAGKVQLAAEYFPDAKVYLDLNNTAHLPDYLKTKEI
jgi:transcriptional regulator GlxA family with amidase domain